MELTDAEIDWKDLCYEGIFQKPLTQLCRWSWCLYIMCICTLTSHSNYTACPCAVDLCTRPFALEKCDFLYLLKLWYLKAKLSIRITTELCSPCSYQSAAPEVVITSVPPRWLSANSTQDTIVSSSPYSLMFHSVGDFKVSTWDMHKCACTPLP